jgi:serine/threonine-protein kinase
MTKHDVSPPSKPVSISPDVPFALPFTRGDVISGKYEVLGLTGAGGVGYVVSAMHVELGEPVALKFLRPQALAHPELVARFAREARAAARIKSEYVARVYDVGSLPSGEPFIVMEYLEGLDLGAVMQRSGPMPVLKAAEYVMQACEGLASAHALGIVHRDVKPGNLFLARRGSGMETVKVLDFGISKVALGGSSSKAHQAFVQTTMLMGSPIYMSPEQIRTCDEVDQRTDVWSLGCVLFELLTGGCVFNAPTLMQLSAAILERNPVPLRSLLPDAPPELEAIVAKCLEKDAKKRFQNVAELALALFPFAPPRARLSAERCVLLVNRPSAAPPSFDAEEAVTESSRMRQSSALTRPAAREETLPSSRGALPAAIALSTSVPPSQPAIVNPDEIPSFRPRYRRPLVTLASASLLAIGGYLAWMDLHPAQVSQAIASLMPGTQAPALSPERAAHDGQNVPASAVLPGETNQAAAATPTQAASLGPASPAARAATPPPQPAAKQNSRPQASPQPQGSPRPHSAPRPQVARPPVPKPAVSTNKLSAASSAPRHVQEEEPDVGF